jgi:tRNA A-37 threonylcarbamoyl transferase component Bud32
MHAMAPPGEMQVGNDSCAVMKHVPEEDFMVSQTQAVASQYFRPPLPNLDQEVHARLVSVTQAGFRYELKKDKRQIFMGRHPDCEIPITDKRVSARHLRIYRDDSFRYYVEELSSNGCYINEHYMKKGETKSLQHGDEISIGVFTEGTNKKEIFCAFIFRVADHESDSARNPSPDPNAAPVSSTAARREVKNANSNDVVLATPRGSHHKSEQWVRDHWDTRTMLGSGNFSEVRLGVKVVDGQKHAVKIIDKKKFLQFQNKRETHLKLSSEADVLLKLSHPGIVGFYEWFETDMHLYLVMELLSGGDLLQCILEGGCFSEAMARRLFRELCDAVKYLHVNSIVHRDLKPENILLTTKDRRNMSLKIADFGLARMNMKSNDCKTFCGTPHYFAPEVINSFRDKADASAGYGKQADLWSLGVILYIMLSGMPPFEEDGLYEQILEGRYEFDVREWTTVSPEAKELVRRLMTVNPKDRLKIAEACEHRWFRFSMPSSCQSPRERPVPPTFCMDAPPAASGADVQPMQVVQEPDAKRRRTEDAPMPEVTEHSPLGA